jgi:uncharacterized Fe-S radical SAM superfamily protein PflX
MKLLLVLLLGSLAKASPFLSGRQSKSADYASCSTEVCEISSYECKPYKILLDSEILTIKKEHSKKPCGRRCRADKRCQTFAGHGMCRLYDEPMYENFIRHILELLISLKTTLYGGQ